VTTRRCIFRFFRWLRRRSSPLPALTLGLGVLLLDGGVLAPAACRWAACQRRTCRWHSGSWQ
jgi:hypothetical protein